VENSEKILTTKNDADIEPYIERSACDINIARAGIFASKKTRGFRKISGWVEQENGVRIENNVRIGTWNDTGKTLDSDDELVMLAAYGAWERFGCRMENRQLNVALRRALEWEHDDKIGSRNYSARDYKKLNNSLDKLATIPVTFDRFESKRSIKTETITILEAIKLFDREESMRKGQGYFNFSDIYLNEKICQNIKDGKIKLFYLGELKKIRVEAARLIYNRLEHLGGVVELPFRREVQAFAKECQIVASNRKTLVQAFRRACEALATRKLTYGVISKCTIEHDRENHEYYFVCYINKAATIKTGYAKTLVPSNAALGIIQEKVVAKINLEKFQKLDEENQYSINARANEINKTKYKNLAAKTALDEAIEEFFDMQKLARGVDMMRGALVASEPKPVPYLSRREHAIVSSFTRVLQRFAEKQLENQS